MHHLSKLSGATLVALVGGVIATHAVAAAFGWYVARQTTGTPQAREMPSGQAAFEDQPPLSAIQSHRSYTLRSDASSTQYQPHQPTTYTFSIVDDQGSTVREFVTVHEKIMHVIIVRKDLQEFQHVHPDFDAATGIFTLTNLVWPADGPYRIFADFTPATSQIGSDGQPLGVTLFEDIIVGDLAAYSPTPLGGATARAVADGYTISLAPHATSMQSGENSRLTFTVNRNGQPITNLEPYLGALGHAVVLREGDLHFIHTHPIDETGAAQDGTVEFSVIFPEPGTYKAFAQFQHQGRVFTAEFVIPVAAGTSSPGMDGHDIMPMGNHSQH